MIDGPPVALPAIAAQAFSLALHELTTNASKYGALSQPPGKLHVHWEVVRTRHRPDGPAQVTLQWVDTGVEMASAGVVGRRGYGTELIGRCRISCRPAPGWNFAPMACFAGLRRR